MMVIMMIISYMHEKYNFSTTSSSILYPSFLFFYTNPNIFISHLLSTHSEIRRVFLMLTLESEVRTESEEEKSFFEQYFLDHSIYQNRVQFTGFPVIDSLVRFFYRF